jgi:hypothetical protein
MPRSYLIFGDIEGKLDVLRFECSPRVSGGVAPSAHPAARHGRAAASRRRRQHQRLNPPPQAAQGERRHRLPQLRRGGDVAATLVEGDAHLEPVVTHLPRASCQGPKPRTGCLWACGAGCKARHRGKPAVSTSVGAVQTFAFPSFPLVATSLLTSYHTTVVPFNPGRHGATVLLWADADATRADADRVVIAATIIVPVAVAAELNINALGLGRNSERRSH